MGYPEAIIKITAHTFREYMRSKRLNKIKSKAWRKMHSKGEKVEQAKLLALARHA